MTWTQDSLPDPRIRPHELLLKCMWCSEQVHVKVETEGGLAEARELWSKRHTNCEGR